MVHKGPLKGQKNDPDRVVFVAPMRQEMISLAKDGKCLHEVSKIFGFESASFLRSELSHRMPQRDLRDLLLENCKKYNHTPSRLRPDAKAKIDEVRFKIRFGKCIHRIHVELGYRSTEAFENWLRQVGRSDLSLRAKLACGDRRPTFGDYGAESDYGGRAKGGIKLPERQRTNDFVGLYGDGRR